MTSTDTTPAETWHHHYDDPRDDMVFITKDQVKFRASSRLLSKHRTLSLREIDINENIKLTDAIKIDLSSSTFEKFLNLISITDQNLVIADMTLEQCRDLLGFVEGYHCTPNLIASIRAQLIARTDTGVDAASLLLFAGSRDDWALGREALVRMTHSGVQELVGVKDGRNNGTIRKAQLSSYMARLPAEWQSTLFRQLFYASVCYDGVQPKWSSTATNFQQPARVIKKKSEFSSTSEQSFSQTCDDNEVICGFVVDSL